MEICGKNNIRKAIPYIINTLKLEPTYPIALNALAKNKDKQELKEIFEYYSFITVDNVPTGYYIESLNSNNGKYTLKSYLIYDDFRIEGKIRVELVNNETNEVKNIYYNYPENKVIMKWIDNETVIINKTYIRTPMIKMNK